MEQGQDCGGNRGPEQIRYEIILPQNAFSAKKHPHSIDASLSKWEDDLTGQLNGMEYNRALPERGWSKDKIVGEIEAMNKLGLK